MNYNKINNVLNPHSITKLPLNVLNSFMLKKGISNTSYQKHNIKGSDLFPKLADYINYHYILLANEYREYINDKDNYYIYYDNAGSFSPDTSLRINSQLELLYDIVGENEFKKRLCEVIKATNLTYKFGVGLSSLFKPGDLIKIVENRNDSGFWLRIIDPNRWHGRMIMQFISNPKIYINNRFSNEFILKNNPELLIRFLNSENIDLFKEQNCFDSPLFPDDWQNDFWDDASKEKTDSKNYTFLKLLDQFTNEDSNFHIYREFDNNRVYSIKPRLRIFFDILGREMVRERLSTLEKTLQKLKPEEINQKPIFQKGDLLAFEIPPQSIFDTSNISIYAVESQNPGTLLVTLYNLHDAYDIIESSQEYLLEKNPQYAVRL